jgi:hypothetical protein
MVARISLRTAFDRTEVSVEVADPSNMRKESLNLTVSKPTSKHSVLLDVMVMIFAFGAIGWIDNVGLGVKIYPFYKMFHIINVETLLTQGN